MTGSHQRQVLSQALAGKHVALTVTPSQDVVAREMEAPATNGAGADVFPSLELIARAPEWRGPQPAHCIRMQDPCLAS